MSPGFAREQAFLSRADLLPQAVEFVETTLVSWNVPREVVDRALLAVSEAAANAVEHGNRGRAELKFWVALRQNDEEWRLRVRDEGGKIEDEALEAADLPRDPLQTHGRGLFIIRELADAVAAREGAIEMVFRSRK